jgi:catechol 2,3-dioxygenase-like lactoylglutathione lyase family enzyme
MIETEGLSHIHLAVADLGRSLRFYQDVFGMVELFRNGPNMVFLQTPGARDTITLNADPAGVDAAGSGGGIGHFGFTLKDPARLDDALRAVQAAGGSIAEQGEHAPGARYAYVRDPDGYLIEL